MSFLGVPPVIGHCVSISPCSIHGVIRENRPNNYSVPSMHGGYSAKTERDTNWSSRRNTVPQHGCIRIAIGLCPSDRH